MAMVTKVLLTQGSQRCGEMIQGRGRESEGSHTPLLSRTIVGEVEQRNLRCKCLAEVSAVQDQRVRSLTWNLAGNDGGLEEEEAEVRMARSASAAPVSELIFIVSTYPR